MAETFELKIITPERIMYTNPVSRVIFRTTEGEMAVLKGHIPLTAVIESCVFHALIIDDSGKEHDLKMAVHEGFVEVMPDRVTLLTEAAEWPEEIDPDRAERARDRARGRLDSHAPDTDMRRAERALRRAMVRLEAIRK